MWDCSCYLEISSRIMNKMSGLQILIPLCLGPIFIAKNPILRQNSLTVQWLGLCVSTAGGMSSIPGQKLRSHMLCVMAKIKKNMCQYICCYTEIFRTPVSLYQETQLIIDGRWGERSCGPEQLDFFSILEIIYNSLCL